MARLGFLRKSYARSEIGLVVNREAEDDERE
jgi:hypothetical protein